MPRITPPDLIARAVEISTGRNDLTPRAGQLELAIDVWDAFVTKDRVAGSAATGVGKSFSYLAAAAVLWAADRQRTVVSTDAITLQQQLLEKDLPVMAQACEDVAGVTLPFALLKGVSNYVDPMAVEAACLDIVIGAGGASRRRASREVVERALETTTKRSWRPPPQWGQVQRDEMAALLAWAVRELDDEGGGDRATYPDPVSEAAWRVVSATSDEATTSKDETLWDGSPSMRAKEIAAEAAIVVVNHSLLGMQAAKSIPVVLSSTKLGQFHNIVVDEGHTLPSKVRDQGAATISHDTPGQCFRAVGRLVGEADDRLQSHVREVARLEQALETALSRYLGSGNVRRIREGDHPLGHVADSLGGFLRALGSIVDAVRPGDAVTTRKHRQAQAALLRAEGALEQILEPRAGLASWVERETWNGKARTSAKVSPVDVGPMIAGELWTTQLLVENGLGEQDPQFVEAAKGFRDPMQSPDGRWRVRLGVAVVSATLPDRFGDQVRILSEAVREYESPFADAYKHSAFYVPRVEAAEWTALTSNRYGRGGSFDTDLHATWATEVMMRLIAANDGGAIVLAATAKAGRAYATHLRQALPDLRILSQWDGSAPSRIQADWKDDAASVLVGTRSYMTGVDAPGETASLVIVDRPARAMSNPVDDARVELLMESGLPKWPADTRVYATDAALLLEQALGRLIRNERDTGMVAILDPRMHLRSPKPYGRDSLALYAKGLRKFGAGFDALEDAVTWLADRRELVPMPNRATVAV